MRRFLIFTAFLAIFLMVCGCSKEYAVIPVYGKVYVSPSEPAAGQKFKVIIEVKEQGSGFYKGTYKVSITGKSTITKTKEVIDPISSEIVLEDDAFALPQSGTYNISCSAILNASMSLPSGQITADPKITGSTFQVK